jgi:DNA (cytosine-5)-methyltransferase 1
VKFGSLFTGAGGIDLGLEAAGMACVWQCERNRQCRELLERHWPGMERYDDATALPAIADALGRVDVLAGGDPCPVRSSLGRTRSGTSRTPDLSGYVLALVGQLRPRWVVRENVRASDVGDFAAGLELLGYGTLVVGMDAAEITGQSRSREFVVGCLGVTRSRLRGLLPQARGGRADPRKVLGDRPIASCLHTKLNGVGYQDSLVFEEGQGGRIRSFTADERERLAGFPPGWTAGFPESVRCRFCGNACVPAKAEWIGRQIITAEGGVTCGQDGQADAGRAA